jgi:hypothetical protein
VPHVDDEGEARIGPAVPLVGDERVVDDEAIARGVRPLLAADAERAWTAAREVQLNAQDGVRVAPVGASVVPGASAQK